MKVVFRLIVLIAHLLSYVTYCESALLTIMPESLSITNNTGTSVSVTIKCLPGKNGYLYSLIINRNLTTNPTNEIQMAAAFRPDDNVQTITPIPGATASGSLTEGFIMVTMTQVSCKDAGTYRCKANIRPEGTFDTETTVEDKNFTVQVLPGRITLTADPQNIYELNRTLTMTCNGQVGSITSGTEISWVWEFQDYQSFTWISYMTESDITPPTSSLPDNNCQITQVSVLTRRLTPEDSRRTYRCYVRRNGQSFSEFAGVYPIGTISSTDKTPSANTGTTSSASVGPIVGGVIGGLLLLTIIIILVYFLWYRKRDKGEKYQPKETDLPKPADETGPYPSYPPSSIPPSQTRFKRGVANKAMDETEEKPDKKAPVDSKPPRYDNDFRKGGYNPGYDVDHQERPRRYSSDDGGTDRSVNLSVGDGDPNMGTAI